MLKQIDHQWTLGDYLKFRDEGPISPGRVTHSFTVMNRRTSVVLGHVKWFNHWRKYAFFSMEAIFDEGCLQEIIEFCKTATKFHRENHWNK